jgi:hypothetical protein
MDMPHLELPPARLTFQCALDIEFTDLGARVPGTPQIRPMAPPSDIDEDALFELPPPLIPLVPDDGLCTEHHVKNFLCIEQENEIPPFRSFDRPALNQAPCGTITDLVSQLTEILVHQEQNFPSGVEVRTQLSSFDEDENSASPEWRAMRLRDYSSCSTSASTPRKDSPNPSFWLRKCSELQDDQPYKEKEATPRNKLSALLASC